MPTTTRELARIAQISEQTARNWSREYAELLSPSAQRAPRLFDDGDVQTFLSIAALRRANVPPGEVIEQLRAGDVVIDVTNHNTPQQQATTGHTTAVEARSEALLVPVALSSLQRQIDALVRTTRRMEDERATERRNDKLQGALWGAIGALVAGAFVLWVLYLWGG
jgi:DNA-binding transcriptional MerR regulator